MASEAYIGEIRHFSFGFAPKKWAQCNGQTIPINQNQALFSILGTKYGGDGVNNFALPNLQGTAPVSSGVAADGTNYLLGSTGGAALVQLTADQIPPHTHTVNGSNSAASSGVPGTSVLPGSYSSPTAYTSSSASPSPMNALTLGNSGGGAAHENRQPFLVLNVCICIAGFFPPKP